MDIGAAVSWAADEYSRCVKRDKNGSPTIDVGKAEVEPPPLGESYLEIAASNPMGFFKDLVPRYCGSEDDEIDVESIEQDRKSVAEIKKVLNKYKDAGKA